MNTPSRNLLPPNPSPRKLSTKEDLCSSEICLNLFNITTMPPPPINLKLNPIQARGRWKTPPLGLIALLDPLGVKIER